MQILSGWRFPCSLEDAGKSRTLKALSYICRKAPFTNAVQRSAGETDQKFPHLSVHTWSKWQENVRLRCVRRCWREARSAIYSYVALDFAVRSSRIASSLLENIWFHCEEITSLSHFFFFSFFLVFKMTRGSAVVTCLHWVIHWRHYKVQISPQW